MKQIHYIYMYTTRDPSYVYYTWPFIISIISPFKVDNNNPFIL
jgi:hypothetical protein